MELSTPVIIGIALLVLVLLIILIVVGVRASQKRKAQQQEADRQRAAQLREDAAQNEQVVQDRDLKARETELEADRPVSMPSARPLTMVSPDSDSERPKANASSTPWCVAFRLPTIANARFCSKSRRPWA